MTSLQHEQPAPGGVHDYLERAYLEEYLSSIGLSIDALRVLPADEVRQLMRAASQYASVRLSEVETRSHLVDELHGVAPHT